MHRERIRGRGLQARKGSGKQATWEVSVQATPPSFSSPSSFPASSTVPTGGPLSLPSADVILECGTCQLRVPWSWGPTSCREARGSGKQEQGLGKQAIKAAREVPSCRGEERAAGSQQKAKYRDTRRWKWFLLAAGGRPVPSHRSRDEVFRNVRLSSECWATLRWTQALGRHQPGFGVRSLPVSGVMAWVTPCIIIL